MSSPLTGRSGPSSIGLDEDGLEDELSPRTYGRGIRDALGGRWPDLEDEGRPRRLTRDFEVKVSAMVRRVVPRAAHPSDLGLPPTVRRSVADYGGLARELRAAENRSGLVGSANLGTNPTLRGTFSTGTTPRDMVDQRELGRNSLRGKVARLLVKCGLAPPPAPGEPVIGLADEVDDLDLRRQVAPRAGRNRGVPTAHPRTSRPTNYAPARKSAAATASSTFTAAVEPAQPQKPQKPPKIPAVLETASPRGRGRNALDVRPYTEGVHTSYRLLGQPDLDPRFPQAKTARLLTRMGLK